MPRHPHNAREYDRWCRHPDGVSLLARMEVVFSCTFDELNAARQFSAHMLHSGQRVQLRKNASLVQISAVMVPSEENINGFAQTLVSDGNRYGGLTQTIPERRNIFTSSASAILTTYAFSSATHAYQAAIALQEHAQVQLVVVNSRPDRCGLLVCAPSHARCMVAESVIHAYGGSFLTQGQFAS